MATIRFNVKPVTGGKMQIRAVFQNGDIQKFKNTGETIPANKVKDAYKYWDSKNQQVRILDEAHRINTLISSWKARFSNYKDNCKRKEERIDIELFIQSLSSTVAIIDRSDDMTLLMAIDLFKKSMKSSHVSGTANQYTVLSNNITQFQKDRRRTVHLSGIDRTFYKDFSHWLITDQGNLNSTVNVKMNKIVAICNYAKDELKLECVNPDYNKKYKLKEVPAPKFPLQPEELLALHNHKCENEYHQMVLDAFLLACETGLRHSDIAQLTMTHIKAQVTPNDGIIKFIDLTSVKKKGLNNMPLSSLAADIVDKYSFEGKKKKQTLFKFEHSQTACKTLKKIFADEKLNLNRPCEIVQMQGAKIKKEVLPLYDVISFHMARNTYITRLLSSGIAPTFVQHNAGHSKLDITMTYFRGHDITRWQETLKILNSKN